MKTLWQALLRVAAAADAFVSNGGSRAGFGGVFSLRGKRKERLEPVEWRRCKFISAYIQATKVTNVREPLAIDVTQPWDQWAGLSQGCCDFIIIINLLHMTDQGLEGMFKGIGQLLKPGGICLAYGPFAVNGIILPECNVQLDNMLQARNPEWGLRDVEELRQLANTNALRLERMLEMPEYTKCLIFRRREL
ncbi:methyltransferase-like 26 B isoform X2 [Podarcis muralis]